MPDREHDGFELISNVEQEADFSLIKPSGELTSEVIRLQLLLVSATLQAPKPLRVLAGTWNVGNAYPQANLETWLRAQHVASADVIAIGAQECKFSSTKDSV